jgi:diguanylate cyclase (GGDEF)-like protein
LYCFYNLTYNKLKYFSRGWRTTLPVEDLTITADKPFVFSPPSNRLLRWLTDPGRHVPTHIRDILLVELFTSTGAVVAAMVNTSVVNVAALLMHAGRIFWYLMVADIALAGVRLLVIRRVMIARRTGGPSPTNLHLVASLAWSSVLGAIGLVAMGSNIPSLQVISMAATIAIAGGNCPRYYPAPRFALAMFSLGLLPCIAGSVLASDHALRVLAVMTPMYYVAAISMIKRLQKISIASLKVTHDSKFQARHDPLTGLLNRFGLTEALRDPLAGAVSPLTLFYLDLDGFKQVNDRFGHPAGDALLQQVGQRLAAGTRCGDVSARIGGDEFVVIAPGLPPEDAEAFAARLIRRIEAPYDLELAGTVRIGVSVGYACAPEDSETLAGLYQQADAALYGVKRSAKGNSQRFAVSEAA